MSRATAELLTEVTETRALVDRYRRHALLVPPVIERDLERLTQATARRLLVPVAEARRLVEVAVLKRGIDALEREGRA